MSAKTKESAPNRADSLTSAIGILVLDSRFPRIIGDVGNPETYPFPVRTARVTAATPERVVHDKAAGLLDAFVDAGHNLVGQGCRAIVTTCGFLALHQDYLASRLPVPVATSALLQLPVIARILPKNTIAGVVTASQLSLTAEHLRAVGADPETPIVGVAANGHFARTFLENGTTLDVEKAREEVVAAALALRAAHPNLGAILLECANMGPYAKDVQNATKLPVFDMISLVLWLHRNLHQPAY